MESFGKTSDLFTVYCKICEKVRKNVIFTFFLEFLAHSCTKFILIKISISFQVNSKKIFISLLFTAKSVCI